MTYFKDLTPYTYTDRPATGLNIGWLDPAEEYSKGDTSVEFKEALYLCCDHFSLNRMRGYHGCDFCPPEATRGSAWCAKPGHRYRADLGNGEIHVPGVRECAGKLYVAPTAIYHYVAEHQYRPPDNFIESVFALVELFHLKRLEDWIPL